jgi:hypothetical protein
MSAFRTSLVLTALYVAGAVFWLWFFAFGQLAYTAYDWPEKIMLYTALQQSLHTGQLPWRSSLVIHDNDRLLGNPQLPLAPDIFLLAVLPVRMVIPVAGLCWYSVGFAGSLALRRQFRLGLAPFIAWWLLFNANGHLISHLCVGHVEWFAVFLLPFLLAALLRLLDCPRPPARAGLPLGFWLGALTLPGAFHLFIWCMLFVLLLLPVARGRRAALTAALCAAAGLALYRLLPALVVFGHSPYPFRAWFISLDVWLRGLLLALPHNTLYLCGGRMTGWWEFDFFIGFTGLLFVAGLGVFVRLRRQGLPAPAVYRALDLPLVALTLLAFLPLPVWLDLPVVERVVTRFFFVPLVVLMLLAVVRWQRLRETSRFARQPLLTTLLLGGMAAELFQHARLWRPLVAEQLFSLPFTGTVALLPDYDPSYRVAVIGGWLLSLTVLVLVAGGCRQLPGPASAAQRAGA